MSAFEIIRSGNEKFPYDLYLADLHGREIKVYLKFEPALGDGCYHAIFKPVDGEPLTFNEIQDLKELACGPSEAIQVYPVINSAENMPQPGTIQLYIFPKDQALNLAIYTAKLPI